jgi:flavin reductase (DIM6/NTAB) family NADH-FMN oxidoreductase RutF
MGDCVLVFGEVTHAAVAADVLAGDHPLIDRLDPLARLGRDEWGRLGPVEELKRIRRAEWPGTFRRRDERGL